MNNILITGGAGFIGRHVVRHFVERYPDYNIVNLDALTYAGSTAGLADLEARGNYTFVQGDICDAALVSRIFAEHDIDGVIHLAAESHVDRSIGAPLIFAQTNVMGTLTLLEAARAHWSGGNAHGGGNGRSELSGDQNLTRFNSREDVRRLLAEKLRQMAGAGECPDVITFAGNGEPTTHPDFEAIIDDTLRLRDEICPSARVSVLSNATMIGRQSVRRALARVDNNILKLDSGLDRTVRLINGPGGAYSVAETVEKMARYGFMGIPFPKEYGGQGCDALTYAMCVEELSRVCATTGVIVSAHTSLCAEPIRAFDSSVHGSLTVNTLPMPSRLSTVISPSSILHISLMIDKPRPLPECSRFMASPSVIVLFPCRNFSKIIC